MAECKVRTVRMDAIYNVVKNLFNDETSGVKTPADVINWFKEKYPQIPEGEIIDSFVVTSPKNVDESKKVLNGRLAEMRKWSAAVNRLGMFLENTKMAHTGASTPSPEITEVRDAIKKFQQVSKAENITDDQLDELRTLLEGLPVNGPYSNDAVKGVIDNLKGLRAQEKVEREQKRVERLSERLGELFKGEFKPVKKPRVPPEPHLKELQEIMRDLYRLAANSGEVDPVQSSAITEKLAQIENYYGEHFRVDGQPSIDAINNAIDNFREIRVEARVDRLKERVAETKQMLRNLDDVNSPDYASIVADNTGIPYKGKEKEIVALEAEYEDLLEAKEAKMDSILRGEKVKKSAEWFEKNWGIKVKGTGVEGMLRFYYAAKQHGWETIRTLAFFLDNSAFFVQLSIPVTIDIARLPYDAFRHIVLGHDVDPFAGVKRVSKVWWEGFWKVLEADLKQAHLDSLPPSKRQALIDSGGTGSAWKGVIGAVKSKHARGNWATQKYLEIQNHPLFDLMIHSGLKISRSRSLTDSEEYFKTNLLNRVPFLGFWKDASEDIMVTTLNMYRVMLFEQIHKMHPDLTVEDYAQFAEGVNNLTGTTKQGGAVIAHAAKVLSAPRLLVAKLKTSIIHPIATIGDPLLHPASTISGLKEGKLKYSSPYRAYMARQMAGIWTIYGFLSLLLPLVGLGAGDDWDETDFMRIRAGNSSYDLTGGAGAIYRTIALIYMLNFGAPEDASYRTKKRINYLTNVKGWDTLSAVGNFGRTRLHPTISRGMSVATGLDFFGEPYADNVWLARAKAAGYGLMPIVAETIDKERKAVSEGRSPWYQGMLNVIPIQIHGINSYTTDSELTDQKVTDVINKLEYQPVLRYPELLNKRREGGKERETAETLKKTFIKGLYRQKWEDALGEIILSDPDIKSGELKRKWNSRKDQIDKEFVKEYKDELNKLELKD